MTTKIESFYQLRRKYHGAHVFGLSIFVLAWIARSVYKIARLDMENLYMIIFIILLLSLCYLGYYAIRFNILEGKIKQDRSLREALHDELFQLNELRAWRTAFFAVIIFNLLVAIGSFFIDFDDFMLIFLTTLLIGFGSYSVTLYMSER
jgi:hypothetical protein